MEELGFESYQVAEHAVGLLVFLGCYCCGCCGVHSNWSVYVSFWRTFKILAKSHPNFPLFVDTVDNFEGPGVDQLVTSVDRHYDLPLQTVLFDGPVEVLQPQRLVLAAVIYILLGSVSELVHVGFYSFSGFVC